MALVIQFERFAEIDLFKMVSNYWPEINPHVQLLRAKDGLPVIIGLSSFFWIKWRFGKPEHYLPIFERFEKKSNFSEFKNNKIFSISLLLSGAVLAYASLFRVDLLVGAVLLFLIYANRRIYSRFYK